MVRTLFPAASVIAVGREKIFSATAGASGRYELSVPAGPYDIRVEVPTGRHAEPRVRRVEVVSHYVARRTREIGIRLPLGADRSCVRRLVVRQAVVPAVDGIAGGLVLAYWWSASVRAVIVGISPHDPWSFATAGTHAARGLGFGRSDI